jgi:hydrogenase expression/formation protein HypE
MMTVSGTISMHHGNGGRFMRLLIEEMFLKHFSTGTENQQADAAILPQFKHQVAFTTDSFVVDPLFFPGGDIGKLAVCGTLNDLAVTGAVPKYLSVGFILEEGLKMNDLARIVKSMAREAAKAGVFIVTGDTKVVNREKCDRIFINTTGIGEVEPGHLSLNTGNRMRPGDKIILNGPPGEHGMTILQERGIFAFRTNLRSDCTNLTPMIRRFLTVAGGVHFMRDATRGGVATVLNEMALNYNLGIEIEESLIPVNDDVSVMCDILGFDPLYIANEGRVVVVAGSKEAGLILESMKTNPAGRNAAIIGEITNLNQGRVILRTITGGRRVLDELLGDQLPRIC